MPEFRAIPTDRAVPGLLFAYGTLAPDGPEAASRGGWSADSVRGRLYDLGLYPGLVELGAPAAGWVEGYVRSVGEAELRERLDPYEGVAEGLYRRDATTTRAGLFTWVYVYARSLPRGARGPLPRWDGRRGVLRPGLRRENLDDDLIDRPGRAS